MIVQLNSLLVFFLLLFVLQGMVQWGLAHINIRHLQRRGHEVPDVFRGEIDEGTLSRMTDYTIDSSRLSSREDVVGAIITLVIVLSGFLPMLFSGVAALQLSPVLSGLVFFGALGLISAVLSVPFKWYRTFTIEKRYGFSTMTMALWVSDLLKELAIAAILVGILLGAALSLLQWAKTTWWLWAWAFFGSFQVLLLWLYPVVIVPLFNKCKPLDDPVLREKIIALLGRIGLLAGGVYTIDAGKRSRHTNAYFTGWGTTKRIVLFDTLLASHTPEEILAVLAHEAGHWKKRHLIKQLLFMETVSLCVFYLAYYLLAWPLLYHTFGFAQPIPFVGLFLLSILSGPILYFLSPFGAMILRRYEREADDFAGDLMGTAIPLCDALKRMAKDNLANLYPHPLYAWFTYSHPPLLERIRRLQARQRPSTASDAQQSRV